MSKHTKLRAYLYGSVGPALVSAMALAGAGSAVAAPCTGPGAPTTTQTKCLTAVTIPGNPLLSFDISWVNADRAEYYLADRSNAGIDIIDTKSLKFKRTIGGFVGAIVVGGKIVNNISGPDGVTSHGRWLYAGDGDSTLKVIDLDAPSAMAIKQIVSTGAIPPTRLDEMALTTDGKLLLAANNAADPPFASLMNACGDAVVCPTVTIISRITVSPSIIPPGAGLSLEQPAWDPKTKRFYVSIPVIAGNPSGCSYTGTVTCHGGMLVIDPATVTPGTQVYGAFVPATNTGVVPLNACSPNGATVGPDDNLLLGCTPGNNPSDMTTLVINAKTKNYANIGGITGSDEVWFNKGDDRYYLGASKQLPPPTPNPVLGVVDGTSVLIETIPQSSGSHSVAADSKRNLIFVPQVGTTGIGHDTTTNGAGICGGNSGCVAVYKHDVDDDDDHDDHGADH